MFADVLESSHKTAIYKSILFRQQKIAVHKRLCLKELFGSSFQHLGFVKRILKDHNPWPGLVVTFFQGCPKKKWWWPTFLLFAYVSSVDTCINDNRPSYIQYA